MTDRGRILVVDDDEMILESLVSILESEGYIASTARTGEEAIAKTEKEFFNAMLIDIHLPDMTGIEVLKALKDAEKDIPVIMTTFHGSEELVIEAFRFGARD